MEYAVLLTFKGGSQSLRQVLSCSGDPSDIAVVAGAIAASIVLAEGSDVIQADLLKIEINQGLDLESIRRPFEEKARKVVKGK